ncbi:MAG: hypothetical protein WC323_00785 [Patescibacteria group bacterium]|jgi:hypothetical protein
MQINYKKILIITGFIILCVAIGYGIYFLFFKSSPIIDTGGEESAVSSGNGDLPTGAEGGNTNIITGTGGSLPEGGGSGTDSAGSAPNPVPADKIARGGITQTSKLNSSPSFAAALSDDGSYVYYYNQDDGKFYKIDSNGQTSLISNKTFYNVENVNWAPDKQRAVIEYPDGANILYNFKAQKQVTLPKHWEDFDFSPQSDKIVAKSMGIDSENRWLITANDDGSRAQAIEHLGDEGDRVYSSWSPNNLSIALFTEGMDFDRQKLYFVGQNKENFKATIVEGRGIDFQWTPSGDKLLYSVYSESTNLKPELWIVDAKGDSIGSNRQRLNLQTWAEKCSIYDEKTIYCAVPKSLPEGAGVFSELARESTDDIYKINLTNNSCQLIAVPDGEYNMQNIIVSENEKYLYFTDSQTNNIHKIQLK